MAARIGVGGLGSGLASASLVTPSDDPVTAWLAPYRIAAAACPRRACGRDAAEACYADALREPGGGGGGGGGAPLARRQAVLQAALVGDVLGVTSAGLHPCRAHALCRDRVPWPYAAVGGGDEGAAARCTTHAGAQVLATLAGFEAGGGGVAASLDAWYRRYHPSVHDAKTVGAIGTDAAAAAVAANLHAEGSSGLVRATVASLVAEAKLAAITAAVRVTVLTHRHPEEVLCSVVLATLLHDALHGGRCAGLPSGEALAQLLQGDEKASAWAQWKRLTKEGGGGGGGEDDDAAAACRAWLSEASDDLAAFEGVVAAALADVAGHNPFFERRRRVGDEEDVAAEEGCGGGALKTLQRALWAVHWSHEGCFPPGLVGAWVRREDYAVPPKHRTQVEKERKMVKAGLIPTVTRDHPGGDVWNVLDAPGGFDAVMWVAVAGGDSVGGCMAAAALLAAHHGLPPAWAAQARAAPLAAEMLRRVVGDDDEAGAAAAAAPAWLTRVEVPTDPTPRIVRTANYHVMQSGWGVGEERGAVPHHEAAESMARLCLCIPPSSVPELHESEYRPHLRRVVHRRGDEEADVDAFAKRCVDFRGDPLARCADLQRRGRRPLLVYCADPTQVFGRVGLESEVTDENQLAKRTTACLALWRRRAVADKRLPEDVAAAAPRRCGGGWPLADSGVVYVPRCLVCRDAAYRMLPAAERFCCAVLLMAHHPRDAWEVVDARVAVRRARHVLEVAAEKGHDALVLPRFGSPFTEGATEECVRERWTREAACYAHVFEEVAFTEYRHDPLKDLHGP